MVFGTLTICNDAFFFEVTKLVACRMSLYSATLISLAYISKVTSTRHTL